MKAISLSSWPFGVGNVVFTIATPGPSLRAQPSLMLAMDCTAASKSPSPSMSPQSTS